MVYKSIENENIQKAYSEALLKYGERDDITAIDVGYKYKNGEPTEELSIRIHVKEKYPESLLNGKEKIPSKIQDISTDVIQANYKASLLDFSIESRFTCILYANRL